MPHAQFHCRHLIKPDGRDLWLYSRRPIPSTLIPTSPHADPLQAHPHLRWHPLRGEWVAYASHRQNRTHLPPSEQDPFAITTDPDHPTELPAGDYEIAVFQNRFPSLSLQASQAPKEIVPCVPGRGSCEVVVFTQDPHQALSTLSVEHLTLLLQVWADRTQALGQRDSIQYVLPFENKGMEMGVTLHHPHGQIYAYSVLPPIPQQMLDQQRSFFRQQQRSLLVELLEQEIIHRQRLLYLDANAVAIVPVCARYPYEVWVAPRQPCAFLADLSAPQRRSLALALKTVLLKYDGLWSRPFPYLMAWFQAPTDGAPHPEWQLHAEFYPPYRSADKLKYLAGTELAAGLYANDTLPEAIAQELQAVSISLE
ncbi:galactose-1-phosphate uridylyltransferase [Lyngbya confervoides]|uniref:Galactose-1-phosphate uridylyltransferase n=1 Tax=Lyngbya confervoides BDU141951 TaxID=1574623 RepID=A0ABD4SZE1_9CYAN|nr:galactose-1-phosphate uridylyltransferase [Lyngbya confervoides]MCM1981831.1 galactose-1-phosphate uridylyltransferase [Lyngbya confervoides BDU141951]